MNKINLILALDKIQYACLCSVLFVLPFSIAMMEAFAGLALACFIIRKIFRPDFDFLKSRMFVFLLLFFLFSGLSVFNSEPYVAKSLKTLFAKWLSYISLFVLACDSFGSKSRVRNAVVVLFISSFFVSIDGLSQGLFHLEFVRMKPAIELTPGVFGITAAFNHYNTLGSYLAMVLPVAISLLLFRELKRPRKIGVLLLAVFLMACLCLTYSRGSWLSFILSLLLMAVLTRRARILGAVVLLFLGVLLFKPALCERFLLTFAPSGDAHRFILWKAALRMFCENPYFGKGVGTFMDRVKDYTPTYWGGQYAHNSFLQIAAETGIFSLTSFITFACLLMHKAFRAFRETKDLVLLGLLCAIFGFFVHCLFDNNLYSLQLTFLFWLCAGMTFCFSERKLSNA